MKRVLFDLFSAQGPVTGGGEYTKKIFFECIRSGNRFDVLIDTRLELDQELEEIISEYQLNKIDIGKTNLNSVLAGNYDRLIICILQRYARFDFSNTNLEIFVVWHDVRALDIDKIHYTRYLAVGAGLPRILKSFLKAIAIHLGLMYRVEYNNYKKLLPIVKNKNTRIFTDSEYSKYSIKYFFPGIELSHIRVLYPPAKNTPPESSISNLLLDRVISEKIKYVLLISCGRPDKNYEIVNRVIERIINEFPEIHFLLIGSVQKVKSEKVTNIKFLSSEDLEQAYKHAYLFVYPSLSEGFGYPPIEAMKYGVPIIASNCSAVPEICGSAPKYFSPFYENDVYTSFHIAIKNWDFYSKASIDQYNEISKRQEKDCKEFINVCFE